MPTATPGTAATGRQRPETAPAPPQGDSRGSGGPGVARGGGSCTIAPPVARAVAGRTRVRRAVCTPVGSAGHRAGGTGAGPHSPVRERGGHEPPRTLGPVGRRRRRGGRRRRVPRR